MKHADRKERYSECSPALIAIAKQYVFDEGNSWSMFTQKYLSKKTSFSRLYKQCPELLKLKEEYYARQGKVLYHGTGKVPKVLYISQEERYEKGAKCPKCRTLLKGRPKKSGSSYCKLCRDTVEPLKGSQGDLLPTGQRNLFENTTKTNKD